jgi:hypothetical protein
VVAAAFGHLCDAERVRLWNYLAERMPAGAPVVIGVLPPPRPTEVALVRYSSRTVGRHVYEGWQSGVPIDGRSMSWTMIYKVVDAATGELVAEHRAVAPWRCDGVDDLRAEIAPLGLTLTEHGEWIVVRGDGSRTA